VPTADVLRLLSVSLGPQWHSTGGAYFRYSMHSTEPARSKRDDSAKPMPATTRSDEIVAKHKKYLWPSVTNYSSGRCGGPR